MLREVFRSVPIPYMQEGDAGHRGGRYDTYGNFKKPYVENVIFFSGLTVGKYPTPNSPTSLYVWANISTKDWPSWGVGFWRFDGKTGKLVRRITGGSGNLGEWMLRDKFVARSGVHWVKSFWNDTLLKLNLGATATALVGDEPNKDQSYTWYGSAFGEGSGDAIPIWRFKNLDGSDAYPFPTGFSVPVIDDLRNRFIHGVGRELAIFELQSGALKYKMQMPDKIVAICLEDDSRCYVLFGNRTVITFDYMRGEVMGMVKVPSLLMGGRYEPDTIKIGWDTVYRRLLVLEKTPDDPKTGAGTSYIRGYQYIPVPVRLTYPIPLKAARQGRQIPVLVQAVGDANEGVSGYQIKARVTGAGMLMGVPVTDHMGNANIQVLCAEHDPDSPVDLYPDIPQYGIKVEATARFEGPDEDNISTTPPSRVAGGTQPGPPTGGAGPRGPNQMPNMAYIVDEVFGSQTWRLEDAQSSNGRGAFTAKCVQAMHDKDARFGHFLKISPAERYLKNNHALDAVCFKNDDGQTQEGASVVTSVGTRTWMPYDRTDRIATGQTNSWVYP